MTNEQLEDQLVMLLGKYNEYESLAIDEIKVLNKAITGVQEVMAGTSAPSRVGAWFMTDVPCPVCGALEEYSCKLLTADKVHVSRAMAYNEMVTERQQQLELGDIVAIDKSTRVVLARVVKKMCDGLYLIEYELHENGRRIQEIYHKSDLKKYHT